MDFWTIVIWFALLCALFYVMLIALNILLVIFGIIIWALVAIPVGIYHWIKGE